MTEGLHGNLSGSQGSLMPDMQDPNPLDDTLAKFALNVISRFFLTSSNNINPDTLCHGVIEGLLSPGA